MISEGQGCLLHGVSNAVPSSHVIKTMQLQRSDALAVDLARKFDSRDVNAVSVRRRCVVLLIATPNWSSHFGSRT